MAVTHTDELHLEILTLREELRNCLHHRSLREMKLEEELNWWKNFTRYDPDTRYRDNNLRERKPLCS